MIDVGVVGAWWSVPVSGVMEKHENATGFFAWSTGTITSLLTDQSHCVTRFKDQLDELSEFLRCVCVCLCVCVCVCVYAHLHKII